MKDSDLPLATKTLITRFLQKLEAGESVSITLADRLLLYQSFGPSRFDLHKPIELRKEPVSSSFLPAEEDLIATPELTSGFAKKRFLDFTVADYAFSWLSIKTVEKVLPVWEEWDWTKYKLRDRPKNNVRVMLETASKLLQGKISYDEVYYLLCEDFNLGLNIDNWVPTNIYCVYGSAYNALELILSFDSNIWSLLNTSEYVLKNFYYIRDFVILAFVAYHSIGQDLEEWFIEDLDREKAFEFWKWWLSEAIPQAWELAQQSKLEAK